MKIGKKVQRVLESAHGVISAGHWCRGAYARSRSGRVVEPGDRRAEKFDLVTAIELATEGMGYSMKTAYKAVYVLRTGVGYGAIVEFNDRSTRRQVLAKIEEVLA